MNNIYVLNKSYKKIGTLSNQGANPQAPYYEDLYTQELETGADTYQFSTTSSKYTQDILEIGNHIMFAYKNRNELFTITSLEYSHYEGYKTIGVYAEGIGFDLLEIYMKRPENEKDEGGRDEDNDGDTSTDDEYADLDDMYLDENGIIVYDKDGSGPPKEEDMYVDENGIIVYRRNKRNRKKDSLEFKNISYSRFLSILLKNTGWSYVCQPGLESVKHDITVRYDTNIFALLQDSMQSYRGVELEFVHELVGGRVQKVIKAYKDGGRGSFVGKRFEYGTNVRGITKMQEVTDSEDDTILYVDNVGVAVQYDVDFALKSAEVPEIEIGDTHYVIDRDFCPPMQIKARIGKIEISFSDPTKNKIYLANNKRISGSAIEDEFGADDVKDIIDDYDDGIATDHYHSELVNDDGTGEKVGFYGSGFIPDVASSYDLGHSTFPWSWLWVDNIFCFNYIQAKKDISCNNLLVGDIYLRGQIIYQNDGEGEEGGSGNNGYFDNISVYNQLDTESLIVNTSATVGNLYIRGLEVVFPDGTKCTSRGWEWGTGSGDNPGTGEGGDNPGTDSPGTGTYVTLAYADEHYASKAAFELTELQCNKNEVDIMELKRIVIGSGSGGDDPSDPGSGSTPGTGGGTISGIPDGTFEYIQTENSAQFFGSEWLNINSNVNLGENNLIISGSLVVFGALEQIDYLHAREADIGTLRVNGTEINPAALAATVSTDLSEYATVEALQEEIRVKDEQIASLEARLAKIEAMLGINN